MTRVYRYASLIAVLPLVLTVAGCSAGTERTTGQRETVPVAKPDVESAAFFDDRLTAAKLRAVDPCALLRGTDLSEHGQPAGDVLSDLGACSNFMKTHDGGPFNVTLYLQADGFDFSKHRIAGLPAEITADSDPCFVRVAYQGAEGMLSSPRSMQLQLDTELPDPCSAAVQIMHEVVEQIRTNPPIADRGPAELSGIDPCTTLDPVVVRDTTMGVTASPEPAGIYACDWHADNGVDLKVDFATGTPETGTLPPADIGGVAAAVLPSSELNSCRVEWEHRRTPANVNGIERVQVQVYNNNNKIPMDPCANALNAARAVKAKLPVG
ncbi:hypothetical protein A8924_6599 [Saccharopolyspora erythraea NRRL 2338]|uniref:hypothetical protein n=1 Tax=Saccharopolyspora erythraea TaxID=1836 RepID=UPI0001D30EEC|nr:hypothetical protein [Saccharopolyspora erythraea]EQD84931.1 hypothetical protein N599_17515 [Saccharopolyspora erythraea D]PFG99065.1 hypothetical protein A8924_6599 [Saccharopolyspora erythraea NRRL 2338]